MGLPLAAKFIDKASKKKVPGLIRRVDLLDMAFWTGWRHRSTDEDRSWDWWSIYLDCARSTGRYELYGALTADDLQGLMVLDIQERRTANGRAITIEYLASNPLNREANRGLKHVGLALIAVAIIRSVECQMKGRTWLESLPGAERFYESLGMTMQSRQSIDGNSIYTLDAAGRNNCLRKSREKA
jgi:hypothetical protein